MYGAAFLLLVFLSELPVEHRALGSVSVYRDGLLSFEQKYFHCVAVRFEVSFDVGSQQTTIIVRCDIEQDTIALAAVRQFLGFGRRYTVLPCSTALWAASSKAS